MPKALVMDDAQAIRGILKRMAGEYRFEVLPMCDGIKGLRGLAVEAIDRLLLCVDHNMSNRDGKELLRTMRADSRFEDLPSIVKPFTVQRLAEKPRMLGLAAQLCLS